MPRAKSQTVTHTAQSQRVGKRTKAAAVRDDQPSTGSSKRARRDGDPINASTMQFLVSQITDAVMSQVNKRLDEFSSSLAITSAGRSSVASAQTKGNSSRSQALVNEAVNELICSGNENTPNNTNSHQDIPPLGAALPISLKGKIWANEFVPFGQLLHSSPEDNFTFTIVNNSVQVNQNNKNRGIFNIELWSQAFSIFCAVYLQKYPEQHQALNKYGYSIREMARQYPGYAWRAYDETFRQQRQAVVIPWDIVVQELYMKAVASAMSYNGSSGWRNRVPNNRAYFRKRPYWGGNAGREFNQRDAGGSESFASPPHQQQKHRTDANPSKGPMGQPNHTDKGQRVGIPARRLQ